MKLNEFKQQLANVDKLAFHLPFGEVVPSHFHITEVGLTTKKFIDCGGQVRETKFANFQIWTAEDTDHRLLPEKLLTIVEIAEGNIPEIKDLEIEVEYQVETVGKYSLELEKSGSFVLKNKKTDCLAKDKCGIEPQLVKCTGHAGGCC